jgi:hypothetical protein
MAADLYLESFPFGSSTALLEAAHAGVPVVLPFDPPFELLVTNHGLEDIVSNPGSEEEYIDHVLFLLSSVRERELLGQVLQDHIRSHHTGDGWRKQLINTYRLIEECKHNPKPIPIADYRRSNGDITISEWHAYLNGDVAPTTKYTKIVRDVVFDIAYEARECGDYRGAFALLWRCLCIYRSDRRMLAGVVKLFVHKICQLWLQKATP